MSLSEKDQNFQNLINQKNQPSESLNEAHKNKSPSNTELEALLTNLKEQNNNMKAFSPREVLNSQNNNYNQEGKDNEFLVTESKMNFINNLFTNRTDEKQAMMENKLMNFGNTNRKNSINTNNSNNPYKIADNLFDSNISGSNYSEMKRREIASELFNTNRVDDTASKITLKYVNPNTIIQEGEEPKNLNKDSEREIIKEGKVILDENQKSNDKEEVKNVKNISDSLNNFPILNSQNNDPISNNSINNKNLNIINDKINNDNIIDQYKPIIVDTQKKTNHNILPSDISSDKSIIKNNPVIKENSIIKENPVIKEKPKIEEKPIIKENPIIKEKPKIEEKPIIKENPIIKDNPIIKEKPAIKENPIIEENPPVKKNIENPKIQSKPSKNQSDKKEEQINKILNNNFSQKKNTIVAKFKLNKDQNKSQPIKNTVSNANLPTENLEKKLSKEDEKFPQKNDQPEEKKDEKKNVKNSEKNISEVKKEVEEKKNKQKESKPVEAESQKSKSINLLDIDKSSEIQPVKEHFSPKDINIDIESEISKISYKKDSSFEAPEEKNPEPKRRRKFTNEANMVVETNKSIEIGKKESLSPNIVSNILGEMTDKEKGSKISDLDIEINLGNDYEGKAIDPGEKSITTKKEKTMNASDLSSEKQIRNEIGNISTKDNKESLNNINEDIQQLKEMIKDEVKSSKTSKKKSAISQAPPLFALAESSYIEYISVKLRKNFSSKVPFSKKKGFISNEYFTDYILQDKFEIFYNELANTEKIQGALEKKNYFNNIAKFYGKGKGLFELFSFIDTKEKEKYYKEVKSRDLKKDLCFLKLLKTKTVPEFYRLCEVRNGDSFYNAFAFALLEQCFIKKDSEKLLAILFDIVRIGSFDHEYIVKNKNKFLTWFNIISDLVQSGQWEEGYNFYIRCFNDFSDSLCNYVRFCLFQFFVVLFGDIVNDAFGKIISILYNEPMRIVLDILPYVFNCSILIYYSEKDCNNLKKELFIKGNNNDNMIEITLGYFDFSFHIMYQSLPYNSKLFLDKNDFKTKTQKCTQCEQTKPMTHKGPKLPYCDSCIKDFIMSTISARVKNLVKENFISSECKFKIIKI